MPPLNTIAARLFLLLPCSIVRLHAPSWSVDAAELEAAFSPQTKLLVLNTPHNPTGKASPGLALEALWLRASKGP